MRTPDLVLVLRTVPRNFEDQAGPLTEMVLASNLAVRLRKKIDWDTRNLNARGLPEVNRLIKRQYRIGWEPKLA